MPVVIFNCEAEFVILHGSNTQLIELVGMQVHAR